MLLVGGVKMILSCHSLTILSWLPVGVKFRLLFQGSPASCPGSIFCLCAILSRHPLVAERQAALPELGESCLLHLSFHQMLT